MEIKKTDKHSLTNLGTAKGAYLLVVKTGKPIQLKLKGKRPVDMPIGWYVYAGSANGAGGIQSRLKHHFTHNKKTHWHIDHLTGRAEQIFAFALEGGSECALVRLLEQTGDFIHLLPGFGSSDCIKCTSHLLMPRAAAQLDRKTIETRLSKVLQAIH